MKKIENAMCKEYQLDKMKFFSFSRKRHTSNDILKLVHTNPYGSICVKNYCGDRYIILLVDDYSRMMVVIFMKVKSHAFDMFK